MRTPTRAFRISNAALFGFIAALLYLALRHPTQPILSLVSLSGLAAASFVLILIIGRLTGREMGAARLAPWISAVVAGAGLVFLSPSIQSSGILIGGIFLGMLAGVLWPSRPWPLIPLLVILAAYILPPKILPGAISWSYHLAVCGFIGVWIFAASRTTYDPAIGADYRTFAFLNFLMVMLYIGVEAAITRNGLARQVFGLATVLFIAGGGYLFGSLEARILPRMWLLPSTRWRHVRRAVLTPQRPETLRRDLEQVASLPIEKNNLPDAHLWLAGQSVQLYAQVDQVIAQFRLQTKENPAVLSLALETFLDLPADFPKTLLIYIQASAWRKPNQPSQPIVAGRFDLPFVQQVWQPFVHTLQMRIKQLVQSGELQTLLALPPATAVYPYSENGVSLDYYSWPSDAVNESWNKKVKQLLTPQALLRGQSDQGRRVAEFLVWLGEIKKLRDQLVSMVNRLKFDQIWKLQIQQVEAAGSLGVHKGLALATLLRQGGICFEAAFLGEILKGMSPDTITSKQLEAEIARCEFAGFQQREWISGSAPTKVRLHTEQGDSARLRLVNNTRTLPNLGGIPLHVVIMDRVPTRLDLDADQGFTLRLAQDPVEMLVFPLRAESPPFVCTWLSNGKGVMRGQVELTMTAPASTQ